jgi:hypothetical protein
VYRSLLAVTLAPLIVTAAPPELSKNRPTDKLEVVHTFDKDMPTGVTISRCGRIFLTFPRWGDPVEMNVAERKEGMVVPYPNAEINELDTARPAESLMTGQSAVVDPLDRLWLCDTGTVNMGPVRLGGAKIICIDSTGATLTYKRPDGRPATLIPVGAKQDRGSKLASFPAEAFERAILTELVELNPLDVFAKEAMANKADALEGWLAEMDGFIETWKAKMDDARLVDVVAEKPAQLGGQRKVLAAKLEAARLETGEPAAEAGGEFR